MQRTFRMALLAFFFRPLPGRLVSPPALAGRYKNFGAAVYCVVEATQRFPDEKVLMNHYSKGIFYVLTIPENSAGGIIATCILGFPEADVVLGVTAHMTLFVSATVP